MFRSRRWTTMYSNLFSAQSVQDLMTVLPSLPSVSYTHLTLPTN